MLKWELSVCHSKTLYGKVKRHKFSEDVKVLLCSEILQEGLVENTQDKMALFCH